MSNPTDSILITTKKLLGLDSEYTPFDTDITVHINTIFSNLTQMGVGPKSGFSISGIEQTWSQYFESDTTSPELLQQIKTYMYMKVKLIFDPPTNSNVMDSFSKISAELEYRMYTQKGGY